MGEYIQVITTTAQKEDALKIAQFLVGKRLAACVQIVGPVLSTYRWKENVEQAEEWLCLIKSRLGLFEELENNIKIMHPYETPEIVATIISAGGKDYFQWLNGQLKES